jgi:hypothetical protein
MKYWEERHEEAKRRLDPSPPFGTVEFWRNAAKVLSVLAGPGVRPETRAKLEALARSNDAETRGIARNALRGVCYWPDLQG